MAGPQIINHPPDLHGATASSFLETLNAIDTHSEELVTTLDAIVRFNDYKSFISSLQGSEVTIFIDFLDRALDAVTANPALHKKCLRSLQKTCSTTLQLPTSHIIEDAQLVEGEIDGGRRADFWHDQSQRRRVFIKYLRVSGSHISEKPFCKQVAILKKLSHPNVLPILGFTTEGQLRMVSSWMENGNIVNYLKTHRKKVRIPLLVDIAKGLEYLHYLNVIHGNLKGANVVIDAQGRALLADYGLSSLNSYPPPLSARWMAPELLEASDAQPTKDSDMYALSMLIIEIFSGNHPFRDFPDNEVIFKIMEGVKPEQSRNAVRLGLTDDLWQIVCECWKKDPKSRPNAAEVVRRLKLLTPPVSQPIRGPPALGGMGCLWKSTGLTANHGANPSMTSLAPSTAASSLSRREQQISSAESLTSYARSTTPSSFRSHNRDARVVKKQHSAPTGEPHARPPRSELPDINVIPPDESPVRQGSRGMSSSPSHTRQDVPAVPHTPTAHTTTSEKPSSAASSRSRRYCSMIRRFFRKMPQPPHQPAESPSQHSVQGRRRERRSEKHKPEKNNQDGGVPGCCGFV